MIDKDTADIKRRRVEDAARALHSHERLWLELRRLRDGQQRGPRWKAAVCRPEEVNEAFAGTSDVGASLEIEDPARLPEWLESLRLHPAQPIPSSWEQLVLFGCDVDLTGR